MENLEQQSQRELIKEKDKLLIQIINSVHNGQKDHKCDSYGKSFSQAGALKTHILIKIQFMIV